MFKFDVQDNTGLDSLVKEVETAFRKTLEKELPIISEEVKRKTKSGADYEGNAFTKYSDAHRRTKERVLGTASPVNLTFTGRMLNSIRHKVTGNLTGEVGPTGSDNVAKASWNQGENKNIPPRFFTAVDNKQITRFIRTLLNFINTR